MEIRSNNKAKHRSQKFAFGIFRLLSLCIVLILFAILGFIIYKGIGAISWDFITSAPTDSIKDNYGMLFFKYVAVNTASAQMRYIHPKHHSSMGRDVT